MWNAERFNQILKDKNLNQIDIDRSLGVKPGLLYRYLSGQRTPSVEQLYRFLQAAGMTKSQLMQERLVDWYSIDSNGST